MKKLFILPLVLLMLTGLAVATNNPADPYADSVVSAHRVVNAGNALGAPDGNYAKLRGAFHHRTSEIVLDMGEGEEIYGYDGDDFTVIEVDWNREVPDCASVGADISDDGFHWLGLTCSSDGFEIPDGATARYIKIKNFRGSAVEIDAIVAHHYLPNNVPEFGILASVAVLGLAGLFIYRKRK